jgi:glycosyltransferase involved in cell wall biosynthesis
MKICMLVYNFYESDSRVRRYAETLAMRGDQVDVLSLRNRNQTRHGVLKGVNIFRIQERVQNEKNKLSYLIKLIRFFLKSAAVLTREHLRKPYDLVHVHSVPDFEVFAVLLLKLTGVKVILDIHDLVPEFYASKFSTSNRSLLVRGLLVTERLSSKFSDHVIASNHLWEDKLKRRSVPHNKITTLLNYPDTLFFSTKKAKENDGSLLMVYPGTFNWHQGLDIAIKAFAAIKDQVPKLGFVLYGDGPTREALSTLAFSLGLGERVRFGRVMALDEIAPIVSQCDIGIVPKRNDSFGGEAFSTKILEFMSLGVPVIVSRTRIDQCYFDDSLVRFFEPENVEDLAMAILSLVEDKSLRNMLIKNGFKYARENSWEAKKKIYLDLVDSLIGSRNYE